MRSLAAAALLVVLASACAAATGYDPKRYATTQKTEPEDPDTQALAPEPRTSIPDPKSPVAISPQAAATPATPAAPVASAPVASAPDPSTPGDAKPKVSPPALPKPPAAPAAAPAVDAECGTKENPCPMQKVMRGFATAQTPEALEAAFTRIAGLSPSGGWAWASIAKRGAELAKAGDVAGAKGQCKACHDQHKDAYKKQFRAKKL